MKRSARIFAVMIVFTAERSFATNPFALASAADKANDIVILSTSISDLASEIGVSSELLQELNAVKEETRLVQDQIHLTKTVSEEVYGLSNPKIGGTKKLAYDIDTVTRYVRRAKNLGSLILRLGGRPEAAAAASLQETNHLLFNLLQGQERAALKSDREAIQKERETIESKVAYARFLQDETDRINKHANEASKRRPTRRQGLFGKRGL